MTTTWSFITNHARALLVIARHADARLRDIASAIHVTERTAYTIVTDLTDAGYVVKERDGRRNRYYIREHLPIPTNGGSSEPTIGDLIGLLSDAERGPHPPDKADSQTS